MNPRKAKKPHNTEKRVRIRIVAPKVRRCFLAAGHLGCPIGTIIFAIPSIRSVMNCPNSWLTSSKPYGSLYLKLQS